MVCKYTFQDLEQIVLTPYMELLVLYLCKWWACMQITGCTISFCIL